MEAHVTTVPLVEDGIFLRCSLGQEPHLSAQEAQKLKSLATATLQLTDFQSEKRYSLRVPLYREQPENSSLLLPKGLTGLYTQAIPRLRIIKEAPLLVSAEMEHRVPLSLKDPHAPRQWDPNQKIILKRIFEHPDGGLIHAPMGAGKAILVNVLVYGLPALRPAVVSGKGSRDVLQLYRWLKAFAQNNPDWPQDPVILWACGKTPNAAQHRAIAQGKGIIVCTHAGLHHLPKNVKLLVLDEVHASATPKRVANIIERPSLRRIYGLSATLGLRPDGGDRLLEALCGPIFSTSTHKEFETTRRVSATTLHIYKFNAQGAYAHNPLDPSEPPPQGYSLQQTWVDNHRGRTQFIAELALFLPQHEVKVIFSPRILHLIRIRDCILKLVRQRGLTLREEDEPTLLYSPTAKTSRWGRSPAFNLSKEDSALRELLLKHGILTLVLCTDLVSTGVDTDQIDHIIDVSGQKALITSIQRTGRGTRPRLTAQGTPKTNTIHVIHDQKPKLLRILGEQKILALRDYYGLEGDKCHVHNMPPWNPDIGHDMPVLLTPAEMQK